MFIQYRESREYAKLVGRHKDLFEVETYSASEIIYLSKQEEKTKKIDNNLMRKVKQYKTRVNQKISLTAFSCIIVMDFY